MPNSTRDSLSGASGPYGAYSFTYYGVGNRIAQTTPAGAEVYSYPATSNRLASVTSSSPARAFGYDANGSVITDTRGAAVYARL
jgi:hypothetical protein